MSDGSAVRLLFAGIVNTAESLLQEREDEHREDLTDEVLLWTMSDCAAVQSLIALAFERAKQRRRQRTERTT